MTPLLDLRQLVTVFQTDAGPLRAVDEISLQIFPGETVGLVGESGCGKSVTALSILRLLPPSARLLQGEAVFQGEDLMRLSPGAMREVRGQKISMIFQDPMTSLNPVFRVGDQIAEALLVHQNVSRNEARAKTVELLRQVGLPDAEERLEDYPHEFSGGQRQRLMIAMALICQPALLIADEPTTALDVTIQAQILTLLRDLRQRFHMAVLLISHDLGIISEVADRVLIMYAGKIVEDGPIAQVLEKPRHPYTLGLLKSLPGFLDEGGTSKAKLPTVRGSVPSLRDLPSGCRFSDRCDYAREHCHLQEPPLEEVAKAQHAACWEWRRVAKENG